MNGVADLVELHDGSSVAVRQMQSTDSDRLRRFHETLSPETTRFRYFAIHPWLSEQEVEHFTHLDHHDREAIVATVDDEIVAVARWYRIPDTSTAEVAFVVADAWQELGLGSAMFRLLQAAALEEGITRFIADTLTSNRRMLAVFRHAYLPMRVTFEDDVERVELDLSSLRPRQS
jgi:RimJ/RimL family protein N-acetyltransferase